MGVGSRSSTGAHVGRAVRQRHLRRQRRGVEGVAHAGGVCVAVPACRPSPRHPRAPCAPARRAWWRRAPPGPTCAPSSALMLAQRHALGHAPARPPPRRRTRPPGSWPPFMPKRPSIASIMSLALTPSASRPIQRMKIVCGTLQPDLAGDHHAQHLGRADAEHVGAERAAGGRMRIAADAEHARPQVAVLRHAPRGRCPSQS